MLIDHWLLPGIQNKTSNMASRARTYIIWLFLGLLLLLLYLLLNCGCGCSSATTGWHNNSTATASRGHGSEFLLTCGNDFQNVLAFQFLQQEANPLAVGFGTNCSCAHLKLARYGRGTTNNLSHCNKKPCHQKTLIYNSLVEARKPTPHRGQPRILSPNAQIPQNSDILPLLISYTPRQQEGTANVATMVMPHFQ